MSSSTSGSALTRSRSLRKPSARTEPASGSGSTEGPRNVSPSRLPVKGQPSSTAPRATRPTRSATVTAASTKPNRPLSGVFGRITSTSSTRQREGSSDAPEPSPATRVTRAASIRQPTRPTTSSGVPTSRTRVVSAQGPSHARAKSSVTALTSTTTLRPPSRTSSTSSTTTSAGTATGMGTAAPDRSRPPLTSLTRRASTKAAPPPPPPPPTQPSSSSSSSSPSIARTPTSHRRQSSFPLSPIAASPSPSKPSPSRRSQAAAAAATATTATTTTTTTTTNNPTAPALKPLTSAILAPPSPSRLPANVAVSAETARLQTELLQLHLLHRDATTAAAGKEKEKGKGKGKGNANANAKGKGVVAEWMGSARARLEERWAALGREWEAVVEGEGGEVERERGRNERALGRWLVAAAAVAGAGGGGDVGNVVGGGERLGMEEKVAVLDEVVSGVWAVVGGEMNGAGGGRYERVVAGFERWAGEVEGVFERRRRRRRRRSNQTDGPLTDREREENEEEEEEGEKEGKPSEQEEEGEEAELELIPELDPAWREECGSLLRRLDDWRRKLRQLGDVPDDDDDRDASSGSGVARVLAGCRALVHGMLAELDLMDQIEREAVAEEMRWVREMNRRGMDDGKDRGAPRAGAIWRVL